MPQKVEYLLRDSVNKLAVPLPRTNFLNSLRLRAVLVCSKIRRGKTSTIFGEGRVARASGEATRRARARAARGFAARGSNFVLAQLIAFFPRIFEQKRGCLQSRTALSIIVQYFETETLPFSYHPSAGLSQHQT